MSEIEKNKNKERTETERQGGTSNGSPEATQTQDAKNRPEDEAASYFSKTETRSVEGVEVSMVDELEEACLGSDISREQQVEKG